MAVIPGTKDFPHHYGYSAAWWRYEELKDKKHYLQAFNKWDYLNPECMEIEARLTALSKILMELY